MTAKILKLTPKNAINEEEQEKILASLRGRKFFAVSINPDTEGYEIHSNAMAEHEIVYGAALVSHYAITEQDND